MLAPTTCRRLAVVTFAVLGSSAAFMTGAHLGGELDRSTRSATVARIRVESLAPAGEDIAAEHVAPATAVAAK